MKGRADQERGQKDESVLEEKQRIANRGRTKARKANKEYPSNVAAQQLTTSTTTSPSSQGRETVLEEKHRLSRRERHVERKTKGTGVGPSKTSKGATSRGESTSGENERTEQESVLESKRSISNQRGEPENQTNQNVDLGSSTNNETNSSLGKQSTTSSNQGAIHIYPPGRMPSSLMEHDTVDTQAEENSSELHPPDEERGAVLLQAVLVEEEASSPPVRNPPLDAVYEAQPLQINKKRRSIAFVGALVLVAITVGTTLAVTSEKPGLTPSSTPTPTPTSSPQDVPSSPSTLSPSEFPTQSPSLSPTESNAPSTSPTFHPDFSTVTPLETPSSTKLIDLFGGAVALSSDGNTVAVASRDAVWVYQLEKNFSTSVVEWILIGQPIVVSQDIFEYHTGRRQALDISGDGTIVAIASENHVNVFRLTSGNSWVRHGQNFTNVSSVNDCCVSIATQLTVNGDILAIATTTTDGPEGDSGYTAMYEFSSETQLWELIGERIPGFQGYTYSKAISLSEDGSVVAVGNPSEIGTGEVRVYSRDFWNCPSNVTWCQIGRSIIGGDYEDLFGEAVSLSADGQILAIGAPGIIQCFGFGCFLARAYRYSDSTNEWSPYGQELSGDYGFGHVVDLSPDGMSLAVAQFGDEFDAKYLVQVWEMRGSIWELGFNLTGSASAALSMDLSAISPYALVVGGIDIANSTGINLYHNN
jgi:hypothetical protein